MDIGLPDADGRDVVQALKSAGQRRAGAVPDRPRRDPRQAPGLRRRRRRLRRQAVRAQARSWPASTSSPRARARRPTEVAGLVLDPVAHAARTAHGEVLLTPTEFRMLAAITSRPGEVVRRRAVVAARLARRRRSSARTPSTASSAASAPSSSRSTPRRPSRPCAASGSGSRDALADLADIAEPCAGLASWWRRDDGRDTGSFRRQIVVSTAVLGALVAMALVARRPGRARRQHRRRRRPGAGDRADAVVSSADAATTAARLDVPDAQLDPGVAVYDDSGRLVAGTVPPSQAAAFDDLATTTGTASRQHRRQLPALAALVHDEPGADGVVVVAEPLRPYENDERVALLVSVAAGASSSLLATALAAWASRRALAPVAAMAATAEDVERARPRPPLRPRGAHQRDPRPRPAPSTGCWPGWRGRHPGRAAPDLRARPRARTPLTAIKATADLVAMRPDLDDELRQDVARDPGVVPRHGHHHHQPARPRPDPAAGPAPTRPPPPC